MLYAGIDIGGTAVKMGILDAESGALVRTLSRDTGKVRPQEMADAIALLLRESGCAVEAAGCVTAGRVNPNTGHVNAGNLQWWNVPLADILRDTLQMPVALDNDVQGALYAEWKEGVCKGLNDVVYVSLGTGIGGAFLIGGRFYRGVGHEGGELGHMVTHADGEPCACGGRGCFERYGSAPALSRMAGGISTRDVFRKAAEGDSAMQDVIRRYAHELCIGLSSVNSIFRPEMLVLGGGLSNAGAALLEPVMAELRTNAPSIPRGAVPNVRLAHFGNDAGLYGAALMARDHCAANQ